MRLCVIRIFVSVCVRQSVRSALGQCVCLATLSLLYSEHYMFIIIIVTVISVVSSAVLGSADTNKIGYLNNNGTLSDFCQFLKRWLTIVTYRWPVRTTGHSHFQRAHTI